MKHEAITLYELAKAEQGISIRGIFYRALKIVYPDTRDNNYKKCSRAINILRDEGRRVLDLNYSGPKCKYIFLQIPYEWVKDSTRSTVESVGTSGIEETIDLIENIHELNYWLEQEILSKVVYGELAHPLK